jgi:poly(glycerol-phosphate) alpha-glucosyltransferase
MAGSGDVSGIDEGLLPPGRQLAITWSIPDAFGGMTAALLRRSAGFARLAGAEVDVLTFDGRPDYPEVRARLAERGEPADGVRVRNLYERLREEPVTPGPVRHEPDLAGVLEAAAAVPGDRDDGIRRDAASDGAARLELRGPDGSVRVAHLRADGTLAVLDERGRAARPRRLITAFDADGHAVRQWASARACYADWIAEVAGEGDAFAIVDSKTAAGFMAHVRLPRLVTLHVVHNAHLEPGGGPLGRLRVSRREVLAHPERFDAIVFLTERQRADAAALLTDPGNFAVVPNAAVPPPGPAAGVDAVADDAARPPASAVVVAGLTPRKRVDHAIRAIRMARDAGVPARLTIVGDGSELAALQEVAREEGVTEAVEFAGHRPDGAEVFAAASVALLTSTSEGAPLVLLEAMARGCIPIAYDIDYGPADVIEHGVSGFLVPPGDTASLARTIAHVATMPPTRRAAVRRAARATIVRFDEAAVTARWGDVQRAAAERHRRVVAALPVELEQLRLRRPRARLGISLRLRGAPDGARVTVDLRHRRTDALLRRTATVEGGRARLRLTREETALLGGAGGLRVTVLVEAGGARARLDGGTVRPDTRSMARRLTGRARRAIRPRA